MVIIKIDIIEKDLFKMDKSYHFIHCISLDAKMEAGIALEFNKRNKAMQNFILNQVNKHDLQVPSVVLYDNIFNLITKNRYCSKPTYESLTDCLLCVKNYCVLNNITKLAMPKIGCGLDKLSWNRVYKIINTIFECTNIEIVVCIKK